MEVTRVEIVPIRPDRGLVGFASIELDGQLVLNCIGIHTRRDGSGYRLTYPTRQSAGSSITVFHPISSSLSKEIEVLVADRSQKVFELI